MRAGAAGGVRPGGGGQSDGEPGAAGARQGGVARKHDAVHTHLADAAADELRILAAKVQDHHRTTLPLRALALPCCVRHFYGASAERYVCCQRYACWRQMVLFPDKTAPARARPHRRTRAGSGPARVAMEGHPRLIEEGDEGEDRGEDATSPTSPTGRSYADDEEPEDWAPPEALGASRSGRRPGQSDNFKAGPATLHPPIIYPLFCTDY